MAPCLHEARKWAVVSRGKGQASRRHASTLTLSHSLQSRDWWLLLESPELPYSS